MFYGRHHATNTPKIEKVGYLGARAFKALSTICPSVRPSHCGIKSKLITVDHAVFTDV